jgi:FAD/FMN-containing dehydrogenase/Fe-S oxidoreductase
MPVVALPTPKVLTPIAPDVRRLARDLAGAIRGNVRFDDGTRALYATDASNYRQVPIGVVLPRTLDDVVAAVAVCRDHDVPVLSRGGGTSLAGQCCNTAVVLDFSRYLDAVESVDDRRQLAIVQPGAVLDQANIECRRSGRLVFGPKPATHDHCTIGGMIGNNSCGSTAQWSGTTAENVSRLEILTYDGTRMWVGSIDDVSDAGNGDGGRSAEILRRVRELRDESADLLRGFPQLPRRISGYNLPALLPENGSNLAQALVGSESTCVTVLRAELKLLREPAAFAIAVLGFDDIVAAARAVPEVNTHKPFVLEGLDDKLISREVSKHLYPHARRLLPDGGAWLMIQIGADSADEARAKAHHLAESLRHTTSAVNVFDDEDDRKKLFAIREAGLGATTKLDGEPDAWPGWEDSAVPPERLGDYLADFIGLLRRYGYDAASLYGHFGHGCLHTSIPFDLDSAAGVRAFRAFCEQAADLVIHYGGSLSGEHGDGQARGELLDRMYGRQGVELFERFKAIFDPGDRMNPGKLVHPNPLDSNLRHGATYAPAEPATVFQFNDDDHRFARAADRCVGVGKCRRHEPSDGVMCPSYQVTREEQHSTRGRARLLFEMLQGDPVRNGWRDQSVLDALDLCLACKGCKSDCPVNVDMATYKAEFLYHYYAGRARPAAHYSLGWLPAAAQLAGFVPDLANGVTHLPGLAQIAKRLAGIDPQREVPRFAAARFSAWASRRPVRRDAPRGPVVLWPDTFTNHLSPYIGAAAVGVLEAAGFAVIVPRQPVCCGLTWISTGQLTIAQRMLRRTVRVLAPYLREGLPIVGLEPSCTAVLRSDVAELLGTLEDVERLRDQTVTFAELLAQKAPEFGPRAVAGTEPVEAIIQEHCHQRSVLGLGADVELLERFGVRAQVLDSGCCGLAGDFGMTRAHREVSFACAEMTLLPAVREADPRTVVMADGFSCRTQIDGGQTGRRAAHLSEVLLAGVRGIRMGEYPERTITRRPGDPRRPTPREEA